jgi:hypothetical protein
VKPALFIGSSSEGIEVARALEYQLQQDAEVTIWNEGFFSLGQAWLESLVNALPRFDFAIVVLTPDDMVVSREQASNCPRDNVMFELGLFMGRLGRSRTFIVYHTAAKPKIPSDLAGVTMASFDPNRADRKLIPAVGPACTLIRDAMRDLGIHESKSAANLKKATDSIQGVSDTVSHLIRLLARSRAVELDVITKQFAPFISTDLLEKMQQDFRDLEDSTSDVSRNI